jgi:hypothetical protein
VTFHQKTDSLDAYGGTQLKKCIMHHFVIDSAKQTRDLFCEFFQNPAGSVPWQGAATGDVQKFKIIITLCNHMN